MSTYSNYNPYSTTSYGSHGPATGGGFYSGGGSAGGGFDDNAGGGFSSPGSASKVCLFLTLPPFEFFHFKNMHSNL